MREIEIFRFSYKVAERVSKQMANRELKNPSLSDKFELHHGFSGWNTCVYDFKKIKTLEWRVKWNKISVIFFFNVISYY